MEKVLPSILGLCSMLSGTYNAQNYASGPLDIHNYTGVILSSYTLENYNLQYYCTETSWNMIITKRYQNMAKKVFLVL